jgi:hypothetical protein
MSLTFNEKKATQAAGRLLEQGGNPMNAMKLIRMLYLADREAILRWGRSITTDFYVFLKHGPVLSQILNLIIEGDDPRLEPSIWSAHIGLLQDGAVALLGPLEPQQLSDGERGILDETVRQHGARTPWELADLTRALPEWRDPHGSAIPFDVPDILAAYRRAGLPVPTVDPDPDEEFLNIRW